MGIDLARDLRHGRENQDPMEACCTVGGSEFASDFNSLGGQ